MSIPKIDTDIPNITAPIKATDVDAGSPNSIALFVKSNEDYNDSISDTLVPKINEVTDKIDATTTAIDVVSLNIDEKAQATTDKAQEASNSADSATESASDAETAKDAAEVATANLPNGTINDNITTPNNMWSSDKISKGLLPSEDIYKLGIMGEIGTGVATCPPHLIPAGFTPRVGHDIIGHSDYGKYIDINGSHCRYVPAHYKKNTGNEIEFSDTPQAGFTIDRSFINAGQVINGLMIYEFMGSNHNGRFCSIPNSNALSTHADHNPISGLDTAPSNTLGGMYQAVKTAGTGYALETAYHRKMLADIAIAHGKASTSTAVCAFIDVEPKLPKGCNNNALGDVNDSSILYTSDGYSNCGKTGSGTPYARTTHNGQECGIADLNGLMWEVVGGFTRTDAEGFMVLKESVDIRTITNDSTTQGSGGAYDIDLYDVIDISDVISGNDGWIRFGNGAEQVFSQSTDRNSNDYKKTSVGIPKGTGVSASGTTEFGNDGLYRHLTQHLACLCGGHWVNSSYAGVSAMVLDSYRASSNYVVGGRALYLV